MGRRREGTPPEHGPGRPAGTVGRHRRLRLVVGDFEDVLVSDFDMCGRFA